MLLRTMHSKRRRGTEGSSVSRKGKIYIVSIVINSSEIVYDVTKSYLGYCSFCILKDYLVNLVRCNGINFYHSRIWNLSIITLIVAYFSFHTFIFSFHPTPKAIAHSTYRGILLTITMPQIWKTITYKSY